MCCVSLVYVDVVDLMDIFNKINLWDIAAGKIIIEEAEEK